MSDEMDEIWALYADDGAQALDAMESALLALENEQDARASGHVAALFRAVHTFKGNSRVLGLGVVESRAHVAEDLIGLVRDQGVPFDDEIRDILLEVSDTLRAMLEETASTHSDVDPASSEGLMTRLKDKVARCSGASLPSEGPVVAPVPEVVPVEPPKPAPEPVPEPAPAPVDATPEPAAPGETKAQPALRRLFDDPTYRDIFTGMVKNATGKLHQAMSDGAEPSTVRRVVDDLAHAARQMGLDSWHTRMAEFLGLKTPGTEALADLILALDELSARDLYAETSPVPSPQVGGAFFDQLAEPLASIARIGLDFTTGTAPDAQQVATIAGTIEAAGQAQGFVRVVEAAQAIARAGDARAFRAAEMRLYEELAAVEAVMPEAAAHAGISPRSLLANWAADHIFDTLASLDKVIDRLRAGEVVDGTYRQFTDLMRLVHHACMPYHIDTAAQLAMSLIDLFSRVQANGGAPDAILTHIARGFIDTLELVFDALSQGERPDLDGLDALFEQASSAAFSSSGVMTATAVERRLGLPNEFNRVLSPESVRAASESIDAGMTFYIVRADINDNEAQAEAFLNWIAGPTIRPITNVTVFRGADTLFDFLLASSDDEATMAEALSMVDPSGKRVVLTKSMRARDEDSPQTDQTAVNTSSGEGVQVQGAGISAEMVETIGEIAASQSMIHHMLAELAETDLTDSLGGLLHALPDDMARLRDEALARLGQLESRLRDVAQLETQLVGRLAHLQEETVAVRSRPVEQVLRPLATYVQTLSQRQRRDARLSFSGEAMMLDISLLETLRKVLRLLIQQRIERESGAAGLLHVGFHRDEEMVMVTLEDDGTPFADLGALTETEAILARASGSIRQVAVPGSTGTRFHISVPLTMVVLEGMVVGVGGVRYVLPVDSIRSILQPPETALIRVSAAGGRAFVRLSDNEVIPVHVLNSLGSARVGRGVYVVVGTNGHSIAIPVDELVGQQLVLLRPLRGVLSELRNTSGTALLAGGEVGMVLSASALLSAHAGTATQTRGVAA